MDPLLAMGDKRLVVEPGAEVRTTVKVRNSGTIVEQYRLDVLGPAAPWAQVVPNEVSVYPGTDLEVQVVLRPPRAADTPSGEVPFAVRCTSMENPDEVAIEEGDVVVGSIIELGISLAPATSRGRWKGRHRIVVDNRGTAAARLRLSARDPNERLSFALGAEVVDVPAGSKGGTTVQVRSRTPSLKGGIQPHRFQVAYDRLMSGPVPTTPPTGTTADGVFEQKPVLTKGLLGIAGLVAAGGVAFALLSMRGGDGDEATGGRTPPPVPTLQTVEAVGSTGVQVVWANNPNVTGYEVQQVAPETATTSAPAVVATQDLDAALSRFTWTDLAAGTTYCFQVVASNDVGPSAPTKAQCAETPAPAPYAPPTGLTATPVDGGPKVDLAWQASDAPGITYAVLVDDASVQATFGTTANVEVEPGTRCFSVIGKSQAQETPPSNQVCLPIAAPVADEEPGATSTSAPGTVAPTAPPPSDGGTTAPTQVPVASVPPGAVVPKPVLVKPGWMAQIGAVLADDYAATEPLARAQALRTRLEAAGLDADLAPSQSLVLPGASAWIVYVDGLASKPAADAVCAAVAAAALPDRQSCLTYEKGSLPQRSASTPTSAPAASAVSPSASATSAAPTSPSTSAGGPPPTGSTVPAGSSTSSSTG